MEEKRTIIVAWDFSNVAEYALQHAIRFSEKTNAQVMLLNIVESESDIENIERQLNIVVEDAQHKYNYKPTFMVKVGSIFSTISEVANELDALLVFMGTHGMKGMQKITGSWALKVIEGAKMPFVVVQRPPRDEQFENIVFPIDYKKEDKQKAVWALYLNKLFKSKFFVFVQKSQDTKLKAQIHSNLVFTKSVLDQNKIEYELVEAAESKDFSEQVIAFSEKINANAIVITTQRHIDFADYMFGATEQKIIANKALITVVTVFPKEAKLGGFMGHGYGA
ncbi:MAG: universal stress protein [Bacteroidales bacterium]|jgi:nucleotide-binding universal stress UspA family protein|nr:universal stress protein [Bacteroidales bacterium]